MLPPQFLPWLLGGFAEQAGLRNAFMQVLTSTRHLWLFAPLHCVGQIAIHEGQPRCQFHRAHLQCWTFFSPVRAVFASKAIKTQQQRSQGRDPSQASVQKKKVTCTSGSLSEVLKLSLVHCSPLQWFLLCFDNSIFCRSIYQAHKWFGRSTHSVVTSSAVKWTSASLL